MAGVFGWPWDIMDVLFDFKKPLPVFAQIREIPAAVAKSAMVKIPNTRSQDRAAHSNEWPR